MREITLTGLYRYPVKSLAGQEFESLEVGARGLLWDRDWMLVDPEGRFVTQRQQPRMALIQTRLDGRGSLGLSAPGMPEIAVRAQGAERLTVRVWRDRVVGEPVDEAADAWLSEFLGVTCRLVRLPADVRRPVDADYAAAGDQVGFADGFPFLLISQASLDDLNARLAEPVSMRRFRPNLVIDGCPPYAEDGWRRIRIGGLVFRVAKPCSRCVIPTVDPSTGVRGREPLQTLLGYRKRGDQVYFGQNLLHDGPGHLVLGMSVEVLE